jgi:hypothetical protein
MQRRGASSWQRWVLGVSAAGVVVGTSGLMLASSAAASTRTNPQGLCVLNTICVGSTPTPASNGGGTGSGNPLQNLISTPTPAPTNVLCVINNVCISEPTLPPAPKLPGGGTGPTGPGHSGGGGNTTPTGPGGSQTGSTSTGGHSTGSSPSTTAAGGAAAAHQPHDTGGFGSGGTQPPAAITVPPPAIVQLVTPGGDALPFGKAPFLWPLFVGLDVLGFAAVAFVLRRTWSKPVTD